MVGVTRVTVGISRTVFLTRRYAIKVPCARYTWEYWLRGLLANLQERTLARSHLPGLCPVLFADPFGFIVVMPRAEPLPFALTNASYELLVDRGDYRIPAEKKSDSWGILHGHVVAIDYGN